MHLFTYGTLMIPELILAVTGKAFRGRSALLPDYARYRMLHEPYPALVPETGSDTAGIVYFDVDPRSLERIDSFEGAEYKRSPVKLAMEAGRCLEACTYILDPAFRHSLSPQPWSLIQFKEQDLAKFMREFEGFASL